MFQKSRRSLLKKSNSINIYHAPLWLNPSGVHSERKDILYLTRVAIGSLKWAVQHHCLVFHCCLSEPESPLISLLLLAHPTSSSGEWPEKVNGLLLLQATFVKCTLGRKILSSNLQSLLLPFLRLGGSLRQKDGSGSLCNFLCTY